MNTYEKILLTSLGLLSVSAKEATKALKAIKNKKPSEKELEKFLADLVKEGRTTRKESEKKVRDIIKLVLEGLDIPRRSELQALERKLSRRAKKQ